jgi:hypothetical protein
VPSKKCRKNISDFLRSTAFDKNKKMAKFSEAFSKPFYFRYFASCSVDDRHYAQIVFLT